MAALIRSLFMCRCPKYNKKCVMAFFKHSCWSAVVLGAIMLALGIVLRSAIIDSTSATIKSSGMLFILIGIFIICMGPFAAVYELVSNKNRTNQSIGQTESGQSQQSSETSDPPTYNQVITALKTPSATYSMRYYPQVLSPENLSDTKPPPPSYEEIAETNGNSSSDRVVVEVRRMTAP